MLPDSFKQLCSKIWIFSTEPFHAAIPSHRRRTAHFLTSSLLVVSLFGLFLIGLQFLLDQTEGRNNRLLSSFETLLIVVILYIFSRSRYYKLTAPISLLFFTVAVLYTAYNVPAESTIYAYLIFPIILSSTLSSSRATRYLWGWLLLVALIVPYIIGNADQTDFSYIVFYTFAGGLLILASKYRNKMESDSRAELAQQEQQYRTLLATAYSAVLTIEDDHIVFVNDGFQKLFRIDEKDVIGQPLLRFLQNFELSELKEGLNEPQEAVGTREDGTNFPIEFVSLCKEQSSGEQWVVAIRDITEKKLITKRLLQAQRVDSLGVLAGGIAHDFNNLLTGILAQSSLALTKMDGESSSYLHVKRSIKTTERAGDLTRQLLAYAGMGELDIVRFNLNGLINEARPLLRTMVSRGVQITFKIPDYPLMIEADKTQIRQIIMNLVMNASQATTGRSGEIIVSTGKQSPSVNEKGEHYFGGRLVKDGQFAFLAVADNGIGIAKEIQSRIFDPFFSTKTKSSKAGGHGLGLSTTLGVVRSCNGTIKLDSTVGKGSTFTVLLPISVYVYKPVNASAELSIIRRTIRKNFTIMIVEDEPAVRRALHDLLLSQGIKTIPFGSGENAHQYFLNHINEIDMVILDMQMPGMNGKETLALLRSVQPALPAIISSGYSEIPIATIFRQHRYINFLDKPYDLRTLLACISNTVKMTHDEQPLRLDKPIKV